jgi:hypothetical protein
MLETWLNQELVRFFAKIKNQRLNAMFAGLKSGFFKNITKSGLNCPKITRIFREILEFQVKVKSEVNHTGTVKP